MGERVGEQPVDRVPSLSVKGWKMLFLCMNQNLRQMMVIRAAVMTAEQSFLGHRFSKEKRKIYGTRQRRGYEVNQAPRDEANDVSQRTCMVMYDCGEWTVCRLLYNTSPRHAATKLEEFRIMDLQGLIPFALE